MRIFIGHDSRYTDATKVCAQSIKYYWKGAGVWDPCVGPRVGG